MVETFSGWAKRLRRLCARRQMRADEIGDLSFYCLNWCRKVARIGFLCCYRKELKTVKEVRHGKP